MDSHTIVETPWCPAALQHGTEPWSMGDVQVADVLGEGAISSVVSCKHPAHPAGLAVKMYHKDRMSNAQYSKVLQEAGTHSQLDNPGVVPLYAAFEDEDGVYLAQELVTGKNASKLVHASGGHLSEATAVTAIMRPLVSALCHMHSKGLLHRDVKTENLLMGKAGTACLADFGETCSMQAGPVKDCIGTLDYQAPEIVRLVRGQSSEGYGLPADVWAVGVTAYMVLVGAGPFEAASKQGTYDKIRSAQPYIPSHLSSAAKSFVAQALNKDAAARPTIKQLSEHEWLKSR